MLLGAHLTLMMGIVPAPVPLALSEALVGVEVTNSDRGRSGFQLQFQVGRSGPLDLVDFPLMRHPLIRPFNRVVIVVRFNLLPRVLMDGVITQLTLNPSEDPGASTLTVTGEDVSVMMDLDQVRVPYPAMPDNAIATMIIAKYARYGLVPMVIPPFAMETPVPTRTVPHQTGTDLDELNRRAGIYSHVFYVEPVTVGVNRAYWGPPVRTGFPERALSVNMGPASNVTSVNFTYNALAPQMVVDVHQDPESNVTVPVVAPPVPLQPPLALIPGIVYNGGRVRTSVLTRAQEPVPAADAAAAAQPAGGGDDPVPVGMSTAGAIARAQAGVQGAMEQTATASGELDALQYGEILRARSIVGLRGAGATFDGHWYVQSVSHSIKKGEYRQRFTLNREGTHPLLPLVRP
ncbi:MAG TPA: hypothetical protein VHG93_15995 [Longimicrobium sp.]|nr:hypothetical protein [Longimicrobium sp.]